MVNALPSQSIIKVGKDKFVLALISKDKNNFVFEKIKVNTGNTSNGLIEIIEPNKLPEILIKGGYNLMMQ